MSTRSLLPLAIKVPYHMGEPGKLRLNSIVFSNFGMSKQRSGNMLPGWTLKSLSFSKQSPVVDYCEKALALELIQDFCCQK